MQARILLVNDRAFSIGAHGGFSAAGCLRRLASFTVVLLLHLQWRPQ